MSVIFIGTHCPERSGHILGWMTLNMGYKMFEDLNSTAQELIVLSSKQNLVLNQSYVISKRVEGLKDRTKNCISIVDVIRWKDAVESNDHTVCLTIQGKYDELGLLYYITLSELRLSKFVVEYLDD